MDSFGQEVPGVSGTTARSLPEGEGSRPPAALRPLLVAGSISERARNALNPQQAAATLQKLRELCVAPGDHSQALEEAAEALATSGYKQEMMRTVREALTRRDANPQVGALWMRRLVNRRSWNRKYPEGMDELCRHGEIGYRAVIEFLKAAGERRKARLVRRAVRKHGKWLRTHPAGWGVAAQALVKARCYKQAARWMWHVRNDDHLELPLLNCLAIALRETGREQAARKTISVALSRPDAGERYPALKVWHAMEEALAGTTEPAAAAYKELNPVGWDEDTLCRYYLARGVIRVQQAGKEQRNNAFESAVERIEERFRRNPVYRRELLLRREYRRCLSRMARDAGKSPAGLVVAWRSAGTWSMLLPLLLIPGAQLLMPLYLFRLCTHRKGTA